MTIEYDRKPHEAEEGIVVPLERINPDTLRKMVEEFVIREWSEFSDKGCTLDEMIKQVNKQLKDDRAKVVFDVKTETCNIVPTR